MAGSAVSSPSSQCQSKPVGTTMLPRGPAIPTHWPTAALASCAFTVTTVVTA